MSSKVFASFLHQIDVLTLKLTVTKGELGIQEIMSEKSCSKLTEQSLNSSFVWLGDLHDETT